MNRTLKPNRPHDVKRRDVLAVMGIALAWSGVVVLFLGIFYFLQCMLGIGYEYVLETGADGEDMWRVIPPSMDFASVMGMSITAALLYWRLKRKNQIHAGAFSLHSLRPQAKWIALISLFYVLRGMLYVMNGSMELNMEVGLLSATGLLFMALFSMLLAEGKVVGYLRAKGRSDDVIVRVIAQETLVMGVLSALVGAANAYLDGESIGVVGVENVLSLLTGIAFAVLCCRLYLASGSMMGRGILQMVSVLFTADTLVYSIWIFVADVVLLIGMYAAIRTFDEKTGRYENGLT